MAEQPRKGPGRCLDCGTAIGKRLDYCGRCRDRRAEAHATGKVWIHGCVGCGRPILSIKALCGSCEWANRHSLKPRKNSAEREVRP